jgi:hypothetical protein
MIGPGCGVTVLGRAGLRYREGSRTIFVDGEMLTGKYDFVIYSSSIQAWEGSKEPISEDERRRIVANVQAAFQQNGLAADVE